MKNKDEKRIAMVPRWKKPLILFKTSRLYGFITNSAIFGLMLTLAIFVYEQYKSSLQTKEIVDNLVYVQKSLSTKYLGLFPDYLDHINEILDEAQPKDSVIIFEDVLYYGFTSKPKEFKKMHKRLCSLSDDGCHITIAYYNPRGRTFKRMVLDQHIATSLSAKMDMERRTVVKSERGNKVHIKELRVKDSVICDKYFDKTRSLSPKAFRGNVDKNRRPLAVFTGNEEGLDLELEVLYGKIDSVKTAYLSEDYEHICLHDFENMYRAISYLMADKFREHGVDLIPIDENLSISCWQVADKAILAFPSKYATDEIGFISQDPAFSKYIQTMLNGFKGNYSEIDFALESNEIKADGSL